MDDAGERLASVKELISRAGGVDVELVAVSKTWNAAAIAPFIAAGHRSFGENRVAEAQEKWPALKELTAGIRLHLIGQLQSNKAAEAVALFDVIHSLDRLSLLNALARETKRQNKWPDIYIQVNIGEEPQKGGCAIAEVPQLLGAALDAGLPVVGLMCVPPADTEAAPFFALLQKIARDEGLTKLSMGMSGDFETAVMLGATVVRVGSVLFGSR